MRRSSRLRSLLVVGGPLGLDNFNPTLLHQARGMVMLGKSSHSGYLGRKPLFESDLVTTLPIPNRADIHGLRRLHPTDAESKVRDRVSGGAGAQPNLEA